MAQDELDICKRCGQCCFFEGKPCRHLFMKDGAAFCAIYSHRVGAVVGHSHNRAIYCVPRKNDKRIFPGCPYNQDAAKRS